MSDNGKLALTRFQQGLARSLTRRGKALLESDNLAQSVNALAPLEAYFVVKELGLEDATPILLNASRRQIQTFIDLDCWSQDRPDFLDLDAWLAPFAALGKEALKLAFDTLDTELQVLYIAETLDIYEIDPDEGTSGSGKDVPTKLTTDGFLHLEKKKPNQEREIDPFAVVEALYASRGDKAYPLFLAAKWESQSVLQEQAYQFRAGRLQDLGFPSIDNAISIFAPPPIHPPGVHLSRWAGPPSTLPAIYAQPLTGETLLSRALASVDSPELLQDIERNLIYLTNAAVIGYGESPRDLQTTQKIATRVIQTLCLGIEVLLSPDEPLAAPNEEEVAIRAAGLFRNWSPQDIFRHGHRAVSRLSHSAQQLADDPILENWLSQSHKDDDYSQDRQDREFLTALLAHRPLYAGREPLRPERAKAFESQQELEEAQIRLNEIAGRVL